jgi:hypothetical protein
MFDAFLSYSHAADGRRRRMVCSAERFGKKALGRGRVLLGREEKVEGRAGRIHRTIQVAPLAFHPDVLRRGREIATTGYSQWLRFIK